MAGRPKKKILPRTEGGKFTSVKPTISVNNKFEIKSVDRSHAKHGSADAVGYQHFWRENIIDALKSSHKASGCSELRVYEQKVLCNDNVLQLKCTPCKYEYYLQGSKQEKFGKFSASNCSDYNARIVLGSHEAGIGRAQWTKICETMGAPSEINKMQWKRRHAEMVRLMFLLARRLLHLLERKQRLNLERH